MMPRVNNGELNSPFTYVFQSAFMLLKNLFIYDEVLNPGVLHRPWLFVTGMALFKALVIGSCIQASIKKQSDDLVAFGLWMMASLLISPNGSSYSLVLLLIPALALPGLSMPSARRPLLLFAGIFVLLLIGNMAIQKLAGSPLLLQYPRLYLLLLFFGGMAWLAGARLRYKWLVILFIVFAGLDARWLMRDGDKSTYLIDKETHRQMYDNTIRDNQLVYYYWDDGGSHEVSTFYTVTAVNDQDVRITDNQLYYRGKKLSSTRDWKKKAIVADGKYIIYLSDKDRGAGFYTLRKLALP
jgi:hypothetical protein